MAVKGINRFPGPAHRIPNFVGAERAFSTLADTDEWRTAATVKANPDAPQLPVRARALDDGKLLYMAVPRLAGDDPFFVLDPARLADPPRRAASIKGAARSARAVDFDAMEPADLVATPTRLIRCPRGEPARLPRLEWGDLTEEKIVAIPVLARQRRREGRS